VDDRAESWFLLIALQLEVHFVISANQNSQMDNWRQL
jgi:hypothetical protein